MDVDQRKSNNSDNNILYFSLKKQQSRKERYEFDVKFSIKE